MPGEVGRRGFQRAGLSLKREELVQLSGPLEGDQMS